MVVWRDVVGIERGSGAEEASIVTVGGAGVVVGEVKAVSS